MNEKYTAYASYWTEKLLPSLVIFAVSVVIALSLWSFRPQDLSWLYSASDGTCENMLGFVGANVAAILVYCFGSVAYLVPIILWYASLFTLGIKHTQEELDKIFGIAVGFVILCALATYYQVGYSDFSPCGGIVGQYFFSMLRLFDRGAQGVILYALLFAASILVLRFAHLQFAHYVVKSLYAVFLYMIQIDHFPARLVRALSSTLAWIFVKIGQFCVWIYRVLCGAVITDSASSIVQIEREDQAVDVEVEHMLAMLRESQALQGHDQSAPLASPQVAAGTQQSSAAPDVQPAPKPKKYFLPDVEKMLARGNYKQTPQADLEALGEQAGILEEKLGLFGIKGKVVRVHPGPVITLYEYKPDVHIKLSRILGLEDDLAMALQALSIRIIAPIPGKDVVGFEVSNKVRKSVLLSDIFHSASWTKFKGSLPLILGEDTSGNHMVVDLASMPHVLIAGSTGSGKSVALNCMLVSLLCAKKPEDMKLIIIDPKQIEFTSYEKIAHLLFPVVNDPKKALPIFKWLVMTMEDRYEQMAQVGVKNIFEYHKLEQDRSDLEHMPFIVVMIDELADLMMTTGKDIEGLIARLAQMSRAAGIHMIVATQRPSVDVITGLIKVNFPNRISFKVTSKVDSRTILDEIGAERLLGKGDMLFIDAKDPHIKRVHGAYVSENEIAYLVSHIESQQAPQFLDISDFFSSEADDQLLENDQELFEQIVAMLKECDEVSISMIQRRFRIGFNRSARIIETLEARGFIMPNDGGKMRKVIKDTHNN